MEFLSEFFLSQQDRMATEMNYTYNYWLIVMSYCVAAFASYTAFHMVERVIASRNSAARFKWLATGAISMGCGIWAMHFVAMLAVQMHRGMEVRYDLTLTLASAVFAMVAAGFAFDLVSRKLRSFPRLLLGGVVLGAGIGAMHYTGMLAMRMDALIRYDPIWFGASVVVAVVLATLAIWMMFFTVEAREFDKADHRLWTAAVMGLAVTMMHYTAMGATHFLRTGQPPQAVTEGIALDSLMGAVIIGGFAFAILILAWISASLDQRKSAGAEA